ncbi:unnamed protein product [Mytilus edulis]|uniref:Uncharacterized protein n=1 Tax=Mytilus edulis TaxID=6550 RepID=A0A8S3VCJ5_MYTED|nr:unnamed protein product [Mytilus edulis]
MTTYPAIFGRDIMLTCYTFLPLKNSKDCPVRQWSGGTDGRGLMYNGFSSNEEKYEEKNRLVSKQVQLIYRKSGLFYSVNFVTEYKLVDEDCNKKPRVQCELKTEQIKFEGNITSRCPDYSFETSVNENTSPTEEIFNKVLFTQRHCCSSSGMRMCVTGCFSGFRCFCTKSHTKFGFENVSNDTQSRKSTLK